MLHLGWRAFESLLVSASLSLFLRALSAKDTRIPARPLSPRNKKSKNSKMRIKREKCTEFSLRELEKKGEIQ